MDASGFETRYEVSRADATAFARRQLRGRFGFFVVCLLFAVLWGLLCLHEPSLRVLSGVLFGVALFGATILLRWYRGTIAAVAPYAGRSIRLAVSADGIRFSTHLGTSESTWAAIQSVQIVPEGLLLQRIGLQQAIYVPGRVLPPEVADFVCSTVRAAGGRVLRPG